MHRKLLNIILLANAVWLMASCSSDDPGDGGRDTGSEMTFAVSDLSRAAVTTDLNSAGSRFVVYGDMKYQNNSGKNIFDNTIVRYSDGKWVYDDIQYWFPLFEYSFVALHPADAGTASYSNSAISLTYTLPGNFAETSDIVAATHRRIHKENPSSPASPVRLGFFHTMSRLNFRLKNDKAADIVSVKKIKLGGINRTGSFSIAPASLSGGAQTTDDYDFSWSGISNPGDLTANINVDVPENEVYPLFPDDNALLVIPQPDNEDIVLEISYELWDDNNKFEEFTLTAEARIGGWEPGKVYTYTLVIEEISKEIYITGVSVKDWHTPKLTGIPVPEE